MTNLTQHEIERKKELEEKLRTRRLTPLEAVELEQILEKEMNAADLSGDTKKILGILLLGALLIALFKK